MRRTVLLALAAETEARVVLDGLGGGEMPGGWAVAAVGGYDVLLTGVGKANAAGAVARVLDPHRHELVLSVGLAGSLPGSGVGIGDVVVASESVFSDEGVTTPEGFSDAGTMGFPPAPGLERWSLPAVTGLVERISGLDRAVIGPVATVSTCSGTDEAAREIRRRTDALVEAMEGAAVGLAARRIGVPHGEVRVVSNTTGDRRHQEWDLPGALTRLGSVFGPR